MKKFLLSSALAVALLGSVAYAKEYDIDKSHSNVGFKIKHLMISNVSGNFKDYSAVIDYDDASKTFKKMEAKIKVASINTENKGRDDHLQQDDFFKAKAHPELIFVMKSYQKVSDTSGKVTGSLTIAGVTKDISLDAEIGGVAEMRGKEKLGFSLSGEIKRSDFKFAPDSSTTSLGDEIKLNIDVEANAK